MKNIRINCSFCFGKGFYIRPDKSKAKCNVCYGSGRDSLAEYKEKHKGESTCKYCGQRCFGYACESCLDTFEKEREDEDIT